MGSKNLWIEKWMDKRIEFTLEILNEFSPISVAIPYNDFDILTHSSPGTLRIESPNQSFIDWGRDLITKSRWSEKFTGYISVYNRQLTAVAIEVHHLKEMKITSVGKRQVHELNLVYGEISITSSNFQDITSRYFRFS